MKWTTRLALIVVVILGAISGVQEDYDAGTFFFVWAILLYLMDWRINDER